MAFLLARAFGAPATPTLDASFFSSPSAPLTVGLEAELPPRRERALSSEAGSPSKNSNARRTTEGLLDRSPQSGPGTPAARSAVPEGDICSEILRTGNLEAASRCGGQNVADSCGARRREEALNRAQMLARFDHTYVSYDGRRR